MAALVLYFATFLALYLLTKHFLHKAQNLPPSPYPSLPIIGHLYLLKKPLYRTLSQISRRHGPILFFRFGSRPVLLISSPALVEQCLGGQNDVAFANRPRFLMGKLLGYNFTSMAWAPYGDLWRNLRRVASTELLSNHRLQALSGVRSDEVKSTIRRLAALNGEKSGNPDPVNMRTLLFELVLNSAMRTMAGKRYYGDESVADLEEARRFQGLTTEVTQVASWTFLADFVPSLRWVDRIGKKEEKLVDFQVRRDGFMQMLIDNCRNGEGGGGGCAVMSGGKKTMVEVLLALQEKEPEFYTDEVIKSLILVLLTGATETMTNTMEWALSLLLNHPNIMKKAQNEIDSKVGNERLIEESDISQLPYLCNVIKETLRMYPPLPVTLPHESSSEWCKVGGFNIPPRTTMLVNLWEIQNDPKVWGDPESFRPERFEGMGQAAGWKYLPFSAGRRKCPGEAMAVQMVGLAIGSLIQFFDWEKVGSGEELVDMTEGRAITLVKARPLEAKCRPRVNVADKLYSSIAEL
ncbi:unnamed protein product [Linum tenue]|uniref:Cytochrome P450 n=1 Tax=Linum tenue TaxID=586396 RepID=A0AAV0P161_9ROSI|nr:unnamed protein product [Linum tenue]